MLSDPSFFFSTVAMVSATFISITFAIFAIFLSKTSFKSHGYLELKLFIKYNLIFAAFSSVVPSLIMLIISTLVEITGLLLLIIEVMVFVLMLVPIWRMLNRVYYSILQYEPSPLSIPSNTVEVKGRCEDCENYQSYVIPSMRDKSWRNAILCINMNESKLYDVITLEKKLYARAFKHILKDGEGYLKTYGDYSILKKLFGSGSPKSCSDETFYNRSFYIVVSDIMKKCEDCDHSHNYCKRINDLCMFFTDRISVKEEPDFIIEECNETSYKLHFYSNGEKCKTFTSLLKCLKPYVQAPNEVVLICSDILERCNWSKDSLIFSTLVLDQFCRYLKKKQKNGSRNKLVGRTRYSSPNNSYIKTLFGCVLYESAIQKYGVVSKKVLERILRLFEEAYEVNKSDFIACHNIGIIKQMLI